MRPPLHPLATSASTSSVRSSGSRVDSAKTQPFDVFSLPSRELPDGVVQQRDLADLAAPPDLGEQRLVLALGGGDLLHAHRLALGAELPPQRVPVGTAEREAEGADDGAAVQLRRGEVDHGAGLAGLVLEELPDDLLPHALGAAGQRRVEVEHGVLAAQGRAGDEHVPGQHQHAEPVRDEQLGHAAVVLVAPGRARDAELLGLGPAGAAREGDGGDAETVDQVEEAVALGRLAALAVAEHGADVERDVVLLRARDDV